MKIGNKTVIKAYYGSRPIDAIFIDNILAYGAFTNALTYSLNSDGNTYSVTGIDGTGDAEVIIPATHNGKSVTKIADGAFADCSNITYVKIPSSVNYIGYDIFKNCPMLANIDVDSNNSVYKSVNGDVYSKDGKELVKMAPKVSGYVVTIPSSVTKIRNYAVTSISEYKSLIKIPASVTSIGYANFNTCVGIGSKVVVVDENNTTYKSIDGNIYTKDGTEFVLYTSGQSKSTFTMPGSVSKIGAYAFSGVSSLTNLIIQASVTSIGSDALGFSKISSVEYDGSQGEWDAISKTDIGLDMSKFKCLISTPLEYLLRSDDTYTVKGKGSCTDTTIRIPNYYMGKPITIISNVGGSKPFSNDTTTKHIIIGDNVKEIFTDTFYNCSALMQVTIGSSVTKISSLAFYMCRKLQAVNIPASVQTIEDDAFYDCPSLFLASYYPYTYGYYVFEPSGVSSMNIGSDRIEYDVDGKQYQYLGNDCTIRYVNYYDWDTDHDSEWKNGLTIWRRHDNESKALKLSRNSSDYSNTVLNGAWIINISNPSGMNDGNFTWAVGDGGQHFFCLRNDNIITDSEIAQTDFVGIRFEHANWTVSKDGTTVDIIGDKILDGTHENYSKQNALVFLGEFMGYTWTKK